MLKFPSCGHWVCRCDKSKGTVTGLVEGGGGITDVNLSVGLHTTMKYVKMREIHEILPPDPTTRSHCQELLDLQQSY